MAPQELDLLTNFSSSFIIPVNGKDILSRSSISNVFNVKYVSGPLKMFKWKAKEEALLNLLLFYYILIEDLNYSEVLKTINSSILLSDTKVKMNKV